MENNDIKKALDFQIRLDIFVIFTLGLLILWI
jgi:hypothetical protein